VSVFLDFEVAFQHGSHSIRGHVVFLTFKGVVPRVGDDLASALVVSYMSSKLA